MCRGARSGDMRERDIGGVRGVGDLGKNIRKGVVGYR